MGRGGKSIRGGYRGAGSATASSSKGHHGGPKRPPLTHFLCLPLVNEVSRPQLDVSLARFRDLIAESNRKSDTTEEIPLKAIRPLGTIHLTLGVMSLSSIDRLSEAIGFLQTLDLRAMMEAVQPEQPSRTEESSSSLQISLRSLVSMHPPRRTSILYAEPDDPKHVLQPFCVQVRDVFGKAGFLVPDDRPLKLHATILNTIYAKSGGRGQSTGSASAAKSFADGTGTDVSKGIARDEIGNAPDTSGGHGPNAKAPIRLDATSILEQCKDFTWATDFALEKIAICKMGATKTKDEQGNIVDEQYEEVASIPLEL